MTTQKGEREEALEACPRIERLLELSDRLDKASCSESIHADILAAASKEIDAITDDMERARLSSAKAEGEMREALERAALDCAEYLEGIIADMGKCPVDSDDDGWCSKLCESYGCMKMRADHCRAALTPKEGE
jgi:hypothetical protein